MENQSDTSGLIEWLSERPELLKQLERMRTMEDSESAFDFDRSELEMLELVKSIGADSFARCIESREPRVLQEARESGGGRVHGKKN